MNKLSKSILVKTVIIIMIAGAIGFYFGDRAAKEKGFSGLLDLLSTSSKNYPKSFNAESEMISIAIEQKQFEKLSALVEQARREGVIPLKGNKFRKAVLEHNGVQHNIELRLKGKLTDHVKDDKWSFRVKVTDDSEVMGMRRFSLQHPGTRNYVNEWVFHQLARKEGLVALRYDFIEVQLNDNDLGVYALEEHFGQELLMNNGRVPGPILRFDPGLYWQHRSNLMSDIHVVEEYAEFISSNIDTYTESLIFGDSAMTEAFYKAQSKLEAFRSQKLPVDSVFKLLPLARYHALIDLVGGHHSLDWSDVKYYYDPMADRVEPISYESFSVFPTRSLAGSYHFKGPNAKIYDLHDALFNSETFFRIYVQELRRMSDPDHLDSLFRSIQPELDRKLAILYGEFPYKEFSVEQYYKNAEAIRTMLDTPQGIHAYYQNVDTSDGVAKVHLRLGMVESLPIELIAVRTSNKDVLFLKDLGVPADQCIVPAKGKRAPIQIHDLVLNIPSGIEIDLEKGKGWRVIYKVLGDHKELKVTVLPYAYLPEVSMVVPVVRNSQLISEMIMVLPSGEGWVWKPGSWRLNETITVPENIVLSAGQGVEILFSDLGRIEVYGRLLFSGDVENPIRISSSTDSAVIHLYGKRNSVFKNVLLKQNGSGPIIELNSGRLELDRCRTVCEQGSLIVSNGGVLVNRSNVHLVSEGATTFELNASKFISLYDRRIGAGTLLNGTGAYVELTGFIAHENGILLDIEDSEVILFEPKIIAGERINGYGNSRIDIRELPNAKEILDINLDENVELILNGKRVRNNEMVAK